MKREVPTQVARSDTCLLEQTLLDSCLSWRDSAALFVGVKSLPLKKRPSFAPNSFFDDTRFQSKTKQRGDQMKNHMRRLRKKNGRQETFLMISKKKKVSG